MRAIAIVGWLVAALCLPALPAGAQRGGAQHDAAQRDGAPPLAAFAEQVGLRDVAGFVETVRSLRADGRLPPRYVTKDRARAHGWRGGGLCEAWPGQVIGGDAFHDFAGRLAAAPGRRWREADLDPTCRSRGPRRLVFSDDGLVYLSLDHYRSFIPVP